MSFQLKMTTDNAAFCYDGQVYPALSKEDAQRAEIARILRRAADSLEAGYESGTCMDINGNKVGEWSC